MKQTHLKQRLNVACGALGLAIVAAGASAVAGARADEPRVEGATFVRLLYAMGGEPRIDKVDFFVDGKKKLNDVEFGALSKYLRLPSGRHTISVWSNGAARPLLSSERTFGQGAFTTMGAYGTPERARLLATEDSRGPEPIKQARLAISNLAPGQEPVEVLASSRSEGTYALARRLRYGRSEVAEVPPEPTTLRVRVSGRTLKTISSFEPRAGRRYSAYVIGRVGTDLRVVMSEAATP